MMNELAYVVEEYGPARNCVLVRGIQVGRFAVRQLDPREDRVSAHGELLPRIGDYVVEHIASGWGFGEYTTLARALRAADELSAHAESDPTATELAELDAQIGELQSIWLNNFFHDRTDLGFREWRAEYLRRQT